MASHHSKPKQLAFFKKGRSAYGGDLMKKRAGRTGPRPLDTRNTMHLVLRSSKARGTWSFLVGQNPKKIKEIVSKFGSKYGVRVISLANVGNHLHFQVKISNRYTYPAFIRAISAAIAMRVTGAGKGAKMKDLVKEKTGLEKRFWDYRPWSRIVQSFRALLNLRDYIEINRYEGYGYDRAEARWLITGRLPWEARGSLA